MSDIYIRCKWCKVFFGKIVIQKVIEYDQYDACVKRVEPLKIRTRSFNSREGKTLIDIEKSRHEQLWGRVKPHTLIYWNKSNYDTRIFKKILGGTFYEDDIADSFGNDLNDTFGV